MKFEVGNRVQQIHKNGAAKFLWTAFVRLAKPLGQGIELRHLIDFVSFQVHETYPKPHIREVLQEVDREFQVTMSACHSFDMPITVYWK